MNNDTNTMPQDFYIVDSSDTDKHLEKSHTSNGVIDSDVNAQGEGINLVVISLLVLMVVLSVIKNISTKR